MFAYTGISWFLYGHLAVNVLRHSQQSVVELLEALQDAQGIHQFVDDGRTVNV